MINIAILTSEDDDLTEYIVQYFHNYPDAQISCVISNIESDIHKRLRRYKLKSVTTGQYKEIDKILTETKSHFIVVSNYNEDIPPNFCKKYDWKIINLNKTETGINVFYEKKGENVIIFNKDVIIQEEHKEQELTDKKNEMSYSFYPTIIEKVIRETYKKIYKDND